MYIKGMNLLFVCYKNLCTTPVNKVDLFGHAWAYRPRQYTVQGCYSRFALILFLMIPPKKRLVS